MTASKAVNQSLSDKEQHHTKDLAEKLRVYFLKNKWKRSSSNTLPKSDKEEEKLNLYDRVSHTIQTTRTIFLNVTIILLIILLINHVAKEVTAKSIIIEPFEVPEDLAKEGLNGRVLANKLVDQIDVIKTTSRFSEIQPIVPNWSQPKIEAEVPGSGISLSIVANLLRSAWGKEPVKVIGEVYRVEGEIYITARVSSKPSITKKLGLKNLDSVMLDVSQNVIRHVQPTLLVDYQYNIDKRCIGCMEIIEYAIQNEPIDDDNEAYLFWGFMLYNSKDYEGAIAKYEKAIDLDPEHAATYNNWGNVLNDLEDYEGAIAKYEKAIELNPKYINAYSNLGNVLDYLEDYEGAIAKFEKAIELDPKHANSYNNWGIVLYNLKDYEGAIAKFEKAIELDPEHANAYTNWGNVLNNLKDYEGAIPKYEKAIELDPKHADAHNNLGIVLYNSKDYERAIATIEKAIELNPEYPDAHKNLEDASEQLRNKKEAVAK